jgi:hypothetical protein
MAIVFAIVAGAWLWRTQSIRSIWEGSIPLRPEVQNLSMDFAQLVDAAEMHARAGMGEVESLGELGRLYHANGFQNEAERCYSGLPATQRNR